MTPETLLSNQVQLWCGEHGYIVLRLNSGKAWQGVLRNSTTYGMILTNLKAIKLCKEGTSDLLVIMPNRVAFVETKVHPRKPTEEQLRFIDAMRKLGHIAGVVYSIEELEDLLKK